MRWLFQKGWHRVKIGDKWGFINKAGEFVINPQFYDAWDFSEGLAPVLIGDKYGYINPTGEIVIKPQFDYGTLFFLKGWRRCQSVSILGLSISSASSLSTPNLTMRGLFLKGWRR